jgi:hypothetical protein
MADNKLPYSKAEIANKIVPSKTLHHFMVRFSFVETEPTKTI